MSVVSGVAVTKDIRFQTRLAVLALVCLAGTACAGTALPDGSESVRDRVGEGETVCPVMWGYAKDIGAIFNDAAMAVADIDSAVGRRDRWRKALDQMLLRNQRLRSEVDAMELRTLPALVEDIRAGVDNSDHQIEDLRSLLEEHPEVDEDRHQTRTSQLIVRIEKVIDVVKPEMASYGDAELIAAWQTIPACRHGVKDVDVGAVGANG